MASEKARRGSRAGWEHAAEKVTSMREASPKLVLVVRNAAPKVWRSMASIHLPKGGYEVGEMITGHLPEPPALYGHTMHC